MQQVVDLQNDARFRALGVQLISISPDPVGAWRRGGDGRIAWLRDYGAPEHGGAMYVPPDEIASQLEEHLKG